MKTAKFKIFFLIIILLICLVAAALTVMGQNSGVKRLGKKTFYSIEAALVKNVDVQLAVPYHRQEHSLSCEIASLVMALNYRGVNVTENDLLANLPFATKAPRGAKNIWGDPQLGFVGNIDGKIPDGGYGVYDQPLVALAEKYRDAESLTNATLESILNQVAQNNPVIVWGTLESGRDISWFTPEGKKIKAIFGEHTRVVIGYQGTPADPQKIKLLDPVYGKIIMSKQKFLTNWGLLDNMAVVVY